MGRDDLDSLSRVFENMKRAAARGNAKEYWRQHLEFHETFIHNSGNMLLVNLLKTLRMHSLWYRFSYRYYSEDFNKSVKIHQKILRMFKSRKTDPNELERVVRHHIEVALDIFKKYLEDRNDGEDVK